MITSLFICTAPLLGDGSPSAIDDEYIVVFQDNIAEAIGMAIDIAGGSS